MALVINTGLWAEAMRIGASKVKQEDYPALSMAIMRSHKHLGNNATPEDIVADALERMKQDAGSPRF